MLRSRTVSTLVQVLVSMVVSAAAQTKLLRFPDIHGDKVAFTYASDLWTASASGGTATRLTAHPGVELFAKFSPDGKWIAFTGQYDGDEQVYVIPATGGIPRQLTFYPSRGPLPARWGYDNQVYGWTPDGKSIVFRSLRDYFENGDSRLYTVSLDGGLPQPLPMPKSGAGDISPDGLKVVYLPCFATSAPGSATPADGPSNCSSSTSSRMKPRRSPPMSGAIATPCGSAAKSITPLTRTTPSISIPTIQTQRQRRN